MERYIGIDGSRLSYEISYGSKGSIVILGGVKQHFLKPYLFDHLTKQDYTVVMPRLSIDDIQNNLPQLSHRLHSILHNEEIKRPIVIGLREGGTIGMAYSLERPVERLFLVDPVGKDFSRLDHFMSILSKAKIFLIRMLLWYAHDRTWHRFFLECMEYERNILSLNTQIVLVSYDDIFTNHGGIKGLQKLTPKLRSIFSTGNRLTTKRPYDLINRMMAYW